MFVGGWWWLFRVDGEGRARLDRGKSLGWPATDSHKLPRDAPAAAVDAARSSRTPRGSHVDDFGTHKRWNWLWDGLGLGNSDPVARFWSCWGVAAARHASIPC
jgi:hypothetical protein